MHREHRHFVRQQTLQVVQGIELLQPRGELLLGHREIRERLRLRVFQRPAREIAHGINADPRAQLVRMTERPRERHHAAATLAEENRFRRPAALHHRAVKLVELRRARRRSAHFAQIETRDTDARLHERLEIHPPTCQRDAAFQRRRIPQPRLAFRGLRSGVKDCFVAVDLEGFRFSGQSVLCRRRDGCQGNSRCDQEQCVVHKVVFISWCMAFTIVFTCGKHASSKTGLNSNGTFAPPRTRGSASR